MRERGGSPAYSREMDTVVEEVVLGFSRAAVTVLAVEEAPRRMLRLAALHLCLCVGELLGTVLGLGEGGCSRSFEVVRAARPSVGLDSLACLRRMVLRSSHGDCRCSRDKKDSRLRQAQDASSGSRFELLVCCLLLHYR